MRRFLPFLIALALAQGALGATLRTTFRIVNSAGLVATTPKCVGTAAMRFSSWLAPTTDTSGRSMTSLTHMASGRMSC